MVTHVNEKHLEAELREQKQLFENLATVARAVTELPTMEATLQNVLDVATALTQADHSSLLVLDRDGAVAHSILAGGSLALKQRLRIATLVMDEGLAGWVARHRQFALIPDTLRDGRWVTLSDKPYTARSVLAAPLLSVPTLLGILTLVHLQPGHFDDGHLRLMQAAAEQMALAVRNALIFEAQRRMADRQTMLYEVLSRVNRQLDSVAVMNDAVQAIIEFAGWANVAIIVPENDGQHWAVQAASGELFSGVKLTRPLEEGVVGRALTSAQTQYVPDVARDLNYVMAHSAVRSELAVPLKRGNRVLGVLNVESDQLDGFDPDDVLLAESIADAVALAMENARLYQTIADERSRLDAVINSNRDGAILIGMDQRILVINRPALQLLRMAGRPEAWLGRHIAEALRPMRAYAPVVVQTTLAEMRRINRGDEPPAEGEYEVPPNTIHWLNLPVMAGPDSLGRLLVLHDVTKERRLERMRDDLTHTMVHDLRNPLTVILGALDVLKLETAANPSFTYSEFLDIASQSTNQMIRLVSAILDISRLESGQIPLNQKVVSLSDSVAEIIRLQTPLAADKKLHLETDLPPTLPSVWADPALLGRVLQNLIGNTIKFTPEDGLIRVSASLFEEQPGMLQVAVKDDGPGIPAKLKSRLFQKFAAGRQENSGSGLGLAFCRLAVEAHGGRIWVESEPGQGTAFIFTLPIAV